MRWGCGLTGIVILVATLVAVGTIRAQTPVPRIVSVIGVIDGTGIKTVVDILLAVPAGEDEQAAAESAVKAAGAHVPELRDIPLAMQPFIVDGFTWPQFFDKSKRNNLVTQFYNPAGDPTGGAAVAAIRNAEATWNAVRGSSFRFAYGGETTAGHAFDRINTISWAPHGILGAHALAVTFSTFTIDTGEILDTDIQLVADLSLLGLSWRVDGGDVDVQTVLLHEDGHALGLGHSLEPSSIMYASYLGVRRALDVIDSDAVVFLYPAHTSNAVTPRSVSVPFRLVAALGDLAPGGGFFEQSIEFEVGDLNARGDASFASETAITFAGETGEGLFVASPHGISQLERTALLAPGGGVFDGGVVGRVTLNDAGDAAFASLLEPFRLPLGRNAGVYRSDSSHDRLSAVVVPGLTPAPTGGVFEGAFGAEIGNDGSVAFGGMIDTTAGISGSRGMGVFHAAHDGAISIVAAPGTPAPGGGVFDFAGNPTIGGAGDIGFDGHVRGRTCLATAPQSTVIFCLGEAYVKRHAAGIELIAGGGDPAPGGGVFRSAGSALPNARGDVLFAADLTPAPRLLRDVGLFLSAGGSPTVVIRPGDPLPGGGHLVTTGLRPPQFSFNDRGEVAFAATLDSDEDGDGVRDTGVYVWTAGGLQLIARTGTVVPGLGTIAHIHPPLNVGARRPTGGAVLNSRGDVLFEATLVDGLGVLLVAQR